MEGGMDQWMCPTERGEYKFYETSNYTKCFRFFKNSQMTWSNAQNNCQLDALLETGGELASVPDKATNDFLETALIEYGIKKIFWTGGMKNESTWKWSDEMSSWNFSNWDPHDLDFTFVSGEKERVGIRIDGKWRSLPPEFEYPYICQWTFQSKIF